METSQALDGDDPALLQELQCTGDRVIGQAMATLILSEEEALAVEGYRFYAAEAEAFATVGGVAAAEAIIANTEWAIAE